METVTTKKGTTLPLMNLKGKSYLQVAHRIQWFNEDFPPGKASIQTTFPVLTDEQTICTATIHVITENGQAVLAAMATKRETKKDFGDHTEKAETGAIGRALSLLGYGTQFALELDEGTRIVDAPQAGAPAAVPAAKAPASFGRKVGVASPAADEGITF